MHGKHRRSISPRSLLQLIQALEFLSQRLSRSSSSLPLVLQDFIMSKVIYVFASDDDVVKSPHAPDTPIFVQANNIAFSDIIPNQLKNFGIEIFVNYVKTYPLCYYAFCDFLEPFYPKQVC